MTTHDAELVGPPGSRILVLSALPSTTPTLGVLVCSPVHAEMTRNYRREKLLSLALADAGAAVQRFQYRGAGNSDGDSSTMTFESMVADAHTALDRLRERTSVNRVVVLGTRLGGLVAAAVARGIDGAPLALWQPVTDPARYTREILRARLVSELTQGSTAGGSTGELLDQLGTSGSVDVLGYPLDRTLHDSLSGTTLSGELGLTSRPLLLVQFSRRTELSADLGAAVAQCSQAGWPVTTWMFPMDEPWWFADDVFDRTVGGARPIVDFTSSWIQGQVRGREMGR